MVGSRKLLGLEIVFRRGPGFALQHDGVGGVIREIAVLTGWSVEMDHVGHGIDPFGCRA